MKKTIIIGITIIIIIALIYTIIQINNNEKWQTINANDKFSFKLPPEIIKQEIQQTDSFVQQYIGRNMLVSFDYGWYSEPLIGKESEPEYFEEERQIDGKQAKIISYRTYQESSFGGYYLGASFRNIEEETIGQQTQTVHLTMGVSYANEEDESTALRIIESIDFP